MLIFASLTQFYTSLKSKHFTIKCYKRTCTITIAYLHNCFISVKFTVLIFHIGWILWLYIDKTNYLFSLSVYVVHPRIILYFQIYCIYCFEDQTVRFIKTVLLCRNSLLSQIYVELSYSYCAEVPPFLSKYVYDQLLYYYVRPL